MLEKLDREKYWVWDDGVSGTRNQINTDDIFFPKNFVWGTATAAHQVEGDCTNNWSEFEKIPNKIKRNQTSGKACEHWKLYSSDINLISSLNLNAYRFSIEWSKIEPNEGFYSAVAINHYHEVIDDLLDKGITPWITLHHFSHPIWFSNKGEFEKKENIHYFVKFAVNMVKEYGKKVKHWCTINEPSVFTTSGWFLGVFPPGKSNFYLTGTTLKNVLEAHVQVYHSIKALENGKDSKVGIVHNIPQFDPYNIWNPIDHLLAHVLDHLFNKCILDFFKTGNFDFGFLGYSVHHRNPSAITSNDFFGLNYYSHFHVKFSMDFKQPFQLANKADRIMTDMPYPIYPEGFYRALKRASEQGLPIYVTENGIADKFDDRRQLFIRRYLYAMSKAIADGIDVRGYFYWSLMDNFEWAEGYDMKFGLYEVNFETQERKLRKGAEHLKSVILRFR